MGLKKRYHISFRQATNTCQKQPDDKRSLINKFHCDIREMAHGGQSVGPLGKWNLSNIANMDQTPLQFSFADGETSLILVRKVCGYKEVLLV